MSRCMTDYDETSRSRERGKGLPGARTPISSGANDFDRHSQLNRKSFVGRRSNCGIGNGREPAEPTRDRWTMQDRTGRFAGSCWAILSAGWKAVFRRSWTAASEDSIAEMREPRSSITFRSASAIGRRVLI
jgi:hypothetical protein